MAEVVLDASVIVALLYADDSLHQRAVDLASRLESDGHSLVLVDFLVFEALSVLCRRAAQRKTAPPDLAAAVATMRRWFDDGEVRFLAHEAEHLAGSLLDIVTDSQGLLNANDPQRRDARFPATRERIHHEQSLARVRNTWRCSPRRECSTTRS